MIVLKISTFLLVDLTHFIEKGCKDKSMKEQLSTIN